MTETLAEWLASLGAENAFRQLANLKDGAVFVVDRNRHLVFWSEGAETLLGFRADEVLGEHCLKANRCVQCMTGCGVAERGVLNDVPLMLHHRQGRPVGVSKSAHAFFDNEGTFLGAIEELKPRATPLASVGTSFHGLVSEDPAMEDVFQTVRNVAETDASVLVRGESGTGKELVARALHAESDRKAGPFVAINCAALTPSLVESTLFGHTKGAFTGASKDRTGLFEQASGGSLFLDEVAELPLEVQAKLLRVLEERVVTPVGSTRTVPIDVRVIAATHRALREETRAGRFREDLLYRLRVVPLYLPALRERPSDIPVLLHHFVSLANARGPRNVATFAPEAMRALLAYDWPGNVRELRNVVQYAFAVGRGSTLLARELPPELTEEEAPVALGDERARLAAALKRHPGDLASAARALGISRATLWRRRKKYQL